MWVYQENGAYNLRQSLQITPTIIPLLHTHLTGSETKACGLCTDEQTGGESFHNMTAQASPLECWSCKSLEVTQNLHVLYWKQQQHRIEISVHCKSTYTCTLYTIPVISWYVFISSIHVLEKSVKHAAWYVDNNICRHAHYSATMKLTANWEPVQSLVSLQAPSGEPPCSLDLSGNAVEGFWQ